MRQGFAYVVSTLNNPEVLIWLAVIVVAACLGVTLVALIVRKP